MGYFYFTFLMMEIPRLILVEEFKLKTQSEQENALYLSYNLSMSLVYLLLFHSFKREVGVQNPWKAAVSLFLMVAENFHF